MIKVLIFLIVTIPLLINGQRCGVFSNGDNVFSEINGDINAEYDIRVYWHWVRENNSSSINSEALIREIIDDVKDEFGSIGINLISSCHSQEDNFLILDNSFVYNANDKDPAYDNNCFLDPYCMNDGLNVFFTNGTLNGEPEGLGSLPGNRLYVSLDEIDEWDVVPHEIGHCFGLIHTFGGREWELAGGNWECDNNLGITGVVPPLTDCEGTLVSSVEIPFEFVNGTNSNISGDFVVDTPADIDYNMRCETAVNDCSNTVPCNTDNWGKEQKDPNCDTYSPDWNNFMGYRRRCKDHFTSGQISRMKGIIQNNLSYMIIKESPIISAIDCSSLSIDLNSLHIGDIPFNTNLVWSTDSDPLDGIEPVIESITSMEGTYYAYYFFINEECYGKASNPVVYNPSDPTYSCNSCNPVNITLNNGESLGGNQLSGDLIINNGTVVINQKVEFSSDSKVIVKSGAKLIIEGNGLLTKCPDANQWQGVHLEGPSETNQLSLLPGRIEMKNGATIEHAVTGIDTKNNFTVSNYTVERGGGIVNMDSGAKIDNCEIGIYFASLTGKGIPFNSPYSEEQSVINNSFISNCDVGIYMDNNIGLEVNGTVFTDNWPDVEPHMSSFDFTGNTFHYGIEMYAEYPSFRGANIIGNNFVGVHDVGSIFTIESHSNAEPVIFDNNSTFNFGMIVDGDLNFLARENDFYDGTGIQAWESGDFQFNMVERNSFYGNEYGSSVDGVNDIEYLNNCFENTTKDDIEVGNGAKIHEAQGDPFDKVSAGNCFDKRIRTGNNSVEFDYWTETGYEPEPNPSWNNCRYPGDGNFIRRQAESGDEDVNICGTQVNYTGTLLNQYRDCKCGPNPKDCIDLVEALEDEIVRLGNDSSINHWVKEWLIAKYRRCINEKNISIAKILIKNGRTDDAINYLSAQPSFRLRIMAYALMMNAHEIERAMIYLNSLNTDEEGEQDFVNSQNIYLNYLSNRDGYALSKTDRNYLLSVARDKNPYSGYVRSIYYKLTGEKIKIEFVHLDGTKSTTRAISKNTDSKLIVYPNPLDGDYFTASIYEFDLNSKYSIVIRSIDGRIVAEAKLDNAENQINIDKEQGVFLIQLFENDALISTEKLVKL